MYHYGTSKEHKVFERNCRLSGQVPGLSLIINNIYTNKVYVVCLIEPYAHPVCTVPHSKRTRRTNLTEQSFRHLRYDLDSPTCNIPLHGTLSVSFTPQSKLGASLWSVSSRLRSADLTEGAKGMPNVLVHTAVLMVPLRASFSSNRVGCG